MDVNAIPWDMRMLLLQVFRQYRAGWNENDGDYSNRDLLEQKLQYGGVLDELDIYTLEVAVGNESLQHFAVVRQLFGH